MSLMDVLMNQPSPQERLSTLSMINGMGSMTPSFDINKVDQFNSNSPNHWENVAQRMAMNRYGYSPEDFAKLDSIISRESNWDPTAVNPNGGAYGIPQILPSAHPDVQLQNDPRGQIRWLLNYIQDRYGGIDQALAFKDRTGWY